MTDSILESSYLYSELEDSNKNLSEYDQLYDVVKDEQLRSEEENPPDPDEDNDVLDLTESQDSSAITKTPVMDAAQDTEASDDESLITLNDEAPRQTTMSTESIRNGRAYVYANEAYNDDDEESFSVRVRKRKESWARDLREDIMYDDPVSGQKQVSIYRLAGKGIDAAIWIAKAIGVSKIGDIAKFVGKKAGGAMLSLLKLIFIDQLLIGKSIRKYMNSYTRHQKALDKMKKICATMKQEGYGLAKTDPFENKKYVKWMGVGKKLDPTGSSVRIKKLLDVVGSKISTAMILDLKMVMKLLDMAKEGRVGDPASYLIMSPPGAKSTNINPRYIHDTERCEHGILMDKLPNSGIAIYGYPDNNFVREHSKDDNVKEITKAYMNSFMIIGVENTMVTETQMHYMTLDDTWKLIAELDAIVRSGTRHVDLYNQVESYRSKITLSIKHIFFNKKFEEQEGGFKSAVDMLTEIIYLKQYFISKIYLPFVTDVHDYTLTYLKVMMSYAQASLKAHKKGVESSPQSSGKEDTEGREEDDKGAEEDSVESNE